MTITHGLTYTFDGSNWVAPGRGFLPGPTVIDPGLPDRNDLVPGTYVPGTDTAGLVDATVAFTDVFAGSDGYCYIDANVSTAADPIRNTRYWGKVKCRVTGTVYFQNCAFYNRQPEAMWTAGVAGNGGCIENFGSAPPLVVLTDCLLDPKAWFDSGQSDYWGHPAQVGIHGGNFEAYRTEFRNCQDGVNYVGPNTDAAADAAHCVMRGCWVHKNFYYKPWIVPAGFPGAGGAGPGAPASGDTHSDAFQFNTGKNILLEFNMFGGVYDPAGYIANPAFNSGDDCHNSAIIIQQEAGTANSQLVRNVTIRNNWLMAGAATLNAFFKNGNTGFDWTFTNNKIARRGTGLPAGAGYSIYYKTGLAMPMSGNVIWDPAGSIDGTGVPAPIFTY